MTRLYGLAEIAETLGVDIHLVRLWRDRGKLPEPTAKLTMGWVWAAEDIDPWMGERIIRAREIAETD